MEKYVLRIMDWHHEACRVMTNGDHEGRFFFYPILTRIMDYFPCAPLDTSFYIEKKKKKKKKKKHEKDIQKISNTLRCDIVT